MNIKPLTEEERVPLIKKAKKAYLKCKCTNTRIALAKAKLGYTNELLKLMDKKQFANVFTQILTLGTKYLTKETRIVVKRRYDKVKRIHNSGKLTNEDKMLINQGSPDTGLPHPKLRNKAMAMDATEGTQKYINLIDKHPIKAVLKRWPK